MLQVSPFLLAVAHTRIDYIMLLAEAQGVVSELFFVSEEFGFDGFYIIPPVLVAVLTPVVATASIFLWIFQDSLTEVQKTTMIAALYVKVGRLEVVAIAAVRNPLIGFCHTSPAG